MTGQYGNMPQAIPLSDEYAGYLRDESRFIGHGESICFPRFEVQVCEILRTCNAQGLHVTTQGARTGLSAGAVPMGGCVLNMSNLGSVVGMHINRYKNFCVTLQPGVLLANLRRYLHEKSFDTAGWSAASLAVYKLFLASPEQFFPPDPTETSASLGGMVSCNASGAKSYRYGATRSHITGLRVALSDGRMLSLRRGETFAQGRSLTLRTQEGESLKLQLPTYRMPQTKSASGYYVEDAMDAIDLFIGMDGTLGVITEIEAELLPLPAAVWGALCFFSAEPSALDFVLAMREAPGHTAALEYFDSHALDILREQHRTNPAFFKLPPPPQAAAAIYFELHCETETQATDELLQAGRLMEAAGGDSRDTWVARNPQDYETLMWFRHAVPECVNTMIDARKRAYPSITKLGTDFSVPDGHLVPLMEMYHAKLLECGLEYAIWGHIGNNHLHVNMLPRNDEDFKKGKEVYEYFARQIIAMGGAVSAEHGVGKLKAAYLTYMFSPAAVDEMRSLKAALDPRGILNVGNLFAPGGSHP